MNMQAGIFLTWKQYDSIAVKAALLEEAVAALKGLLSHFGPEGYHPVVGKKETDIARAVLAKVKT